MWLKMSKANLTVSLFSIIICSSLLAVSLWEHSEILKLQEANSEKIIRMGFNRYPTVYSTDYSRVNLGITLMCAMNNEAFNSGSQTLWLDTYFAGYCLNARACMPRYMVCRRDEI